MSNYTDPRFLKRRNRTEMDVTSPITSDTYKIRKIDIIDFLLRGPLAIPLAEWSKGKEQDEIEQGVKAAAADAMQKDPALVASLNDMILVAGVVSHQVVPGPECGEEQLLPADLGDDQLWLAGEIMRFNGLLTNEQADRFRLAVVAHAARTRGGVSLPSE